MPLLRWIRLTIKNGIDAAAPLERAVNGPASRFIPDAAFFWPTAAGAARYGSALRCRMKLRSVKASLGLVGWLPSC